MGGGWGVMCVLSCCFNDPATTESYTDGRALPRRDARPILRGAGGTERQKRTALKKPKPHGRTNSDRVDMPDGAGRTPVPQSATIQSSKPPPKERFAWLDLLRGVATILVLEIGRAHV